ncbi:MAG: TIGR04086 family membrane protein [Clostridia bacterium]|nr:TIGR04086 family membrane protein [Clostridia bacterium]
MNTRRPVAPRTRHRPARRRTVAAKEGSSFSTYLPRLCKGCGIGATVSVLFCAVASAISAGILCSLPDPDTPLPAVSLIILLLGAVLGGGCVGKLTGERPLIGGICCGLLLLLVMLIFSFIPAREDSLFRTTYAMLLRLALVLFSVLGAYLGSHLPTRRTRKRR